MYMWFLYVGVVDIYVYGFVLHCILDTFVHLLFSRRVCVPIDFKHLDIFDPMSMTPPPLNTLYHTRCCLNSQESPTCMHCCVSQPSDDYVHLH